MAENDPIDVDSLLKLLSSSQDVTATLRELGEMFTGLGDNATTVEQKIDGLNKELQNTDSGFGKNANSSAIFRRSMINAAAGVEALTLKVGGASSAFLAMSKGASDSSASIAKSFDELGRLGKDLGGIFEGLAGKVGLGAVAKKMGSSVTEMIAATERVQDMERGFISLQAATGNLGSVFDNTGRVAGNFDGTLVQFTKNIHDAADATGLSVGTITETVNRLGQVPEALKTSVMGAKGPVSELVAVTQLAAATGQNVARVTEQVASAYSDLNLKGQGAIDFLSTIAATSSALNIPLQDVTSSVNTLANSYAFLTNNTEGAVKAFSQFVPALREAGLSPQQAIKMFDTMAASINQMNTASKSFLAQRSGFGSGLQGAFKIDQMIAEGKIDQVMQQMQKNLMRQFGGNVVTLDQASQSQQSAVQYQRQLEFLKSGAFGGMIKDDQQAAKLFQAMRSGDLTKAGPDIVRGTAATREITARGSSVQERMHTVVGSIATQVQRIAANEDRLLNFMMRRFGGTDENSPARRAIENIRSRAAESTAMAEKISSTDPANATLQTLQDVMGTFGQIGRSYFGEKDKMGAPVEPRPAIPAPRGAVQPSQPPANTDRRTTRQMPPAALEAAMRGASTAPASSPAPAVPANVLARAVNQNIREAQPRSSVPASTLGAATAAPQAAPPQTINENITVKGTIEGFCLNCKQSMEVGHIHEAVVKATDASSARDRARVTMPARK